MSYGTNYEGSECLGNVEVVVPHVSNPIGIGETRSIYVGVAGNVVCRMAQGTADVTLPLGVGWHPLAVTHIRATSTASSMIAGN
jgi:hypothetical protein